MTRLRIRQIQSIGMAMAAILGTAASGTLLAEGPATAPNVTYTATGVFANAPISGDDVFRLAGEPFSIGIVVNAATAPTTNGARWAQYTELKLTGVVATNLEKTPVSISSNETSIELATGNPSYDVFELFAPVSVIGMQINILANIQMPPGTMANAHVHPFVSVPIGSPDTVIYSDASTGTSTTLAIASGTLIATIPAGTYNMEPPAAVQLYVEGAQAITVHADGTESVQSIGAVPIDLGASSDIVALRFYASGVSHGGESRVQIAGQDVPVLYAGRAEYFPGLDQVSVTVPRSLAGSGNVNVVLTVDGRPAKPASIEIQ